MCGWKNAFAQVRRSKTHNILYVTVLRHSASDREFCELIECAEREYNAMAKGFVLVIDMMCMGGLPLHQAGMWMEMFQRVAPVTKERLVQTNVCFSNDLIKFAVDAFLLMYSPIKPFYTYPTREECVGEAKLHPSVCVPRPRRKHCTQTLNKNPCRTLFFPL